jgi:dihydrodipicolinate synthase/N-acetylneuraminate lyase
MSNAELRGVVVPVITPITKKEDVDEPAFRKQIRRLIKAGAHVIFVGGSAGEGPLLADSQWRRMVEIAHDEVGNAVPLLGGVMDTSARRVCEKIAFLKKTGYRFFVLTPTYYISMKAQSEALRLFEQAKKVAGKMEMVAYNIPQCTGSMLAPETMCAMARRGWVRYCKDSYPDFAHMTKLLRLGKAAGLSVLAGEEPFMDRAVMMGAKGIVPVCANYDPEGYVALYEAGIRRDKKALAKLMPELMERRRILLTTGVNWIAGMKYAMSVLGIGSGACVSPIEPAEAKRKKLIDAMIQKHRKGRA